MRTRRLTGFTLTLLSALEASAQGTQATPAAEPAAAPPSDAPTAPARQGELRLGLDASANPEGGAASGELTGSSDPAADGGGATSTGATPRSRPGFETGLRLGLGVPLGKGGRDLLGGERNLNDLTSWRAPLWIDVGYRFSPVTTFGAYAQLGVGGNGDSCAGECDWSDLRIGVQGQWRLAPGSAVDPWIGLGLGYEWLSFRTLLRVPLPDPEPDEPADVPVRAAELLGGPEVTLQAGLDFRVEDSFSVGPYASATLGQYLSAGIKCDPADFGCVEAPSIDGSGLHSWLGIGLRGSYAP